MGHRTQKQSQYRNFYLHRKIRKWWNCLSLAGEQSQSQEEEEADGPRGGSSIRGLIPPTSPRTGGCPGPPCLQHITGGDLGGTSKNFRGSLFHLTKSRTCSSDPRGRIQHKSRRVISFGLLLPPPQSKTPPVAVTCSWSFSGLPGATLAAQLISFCLRGADSANPGAGGHGQRQIKVPRTQTGRTGVRCVGAERWGHQTART